MPKVFMEVPLQPTLQLKLMLVISGLIQLTLLTLFMLKTINVMIFLYSNPFRAKNLPLHLSKINNNKFSITLPINKLYKIRIPIGHIPLLINNSNNTQGIKHPNQMLLIFQCKV